MKARRPQRCVRPVQAGSPAGSAARSGCAAATGGRAVLLFFYGARLDEEAGRPAADLREWLGCHDARPRRSRRRGRRQQDGRLPRGGTAAGFMVGMESRAARVSQRWSSRSDQGKQRSCQPRLAGGHVAIRQARRRWMELRSTPQVLESLGLLSFADCGEVWKVRVRPLSVCDRDHRDGGYRQSVDGRSSRLHRGFHHRDAERG